MRFIDQRQAVFEKPLYKGENEQLTYRIVLGLSVFALFVGILSLNAGEYLGFIASVVIGISIFLFIYFYAHTQIVVTIDRTEDLIKKEYIISNIKNRIVGQWALSKITKAVVLKRPIHQILIGTVDGELFPILNFKKYDDLPKSTVKQFNNWLHDKVSFQKMYFDALRDRIIPVDDSDYY